MGNSESRNNTDNITFNSILNLNEINDVSDVTRDSKIISFDDGRRARSSFSGDISRPSFNEVTNSSDVRPNFSGNRRSNNQSYPKSERINTDSNNISGDIPVSFSSSYISTCTKENLINSMRYRQKLLELIEKRNQVMKNMSIASSKICHCVSDIMQPAGMNISHSNVSSSPLNDSVTNLSEQLDENQVTICELHTSRQCIHEERNTSVHQTTGKLISIDSSGGLLNLPNMNTFQQNQNIPTTNAHNISRPYFSENRRPNNQNDPNSERINTDFNNISEITPISLASYVSTRTKKKFINSMKYRQKLLETIEKKTQLIENMSIESSEKPSNIMPPAGMNISYSNVSSSSLNDDSTIHSGQLDENHATICELHTSRQSIYEEGNTSVRQTTGKLICIDSSHGLSNLSDLNTSRQNQNIPTSNAQNISVHQTTGKLISIDSSGGLPNLPDPNTSQQNLNIPIKDAQNISVHQTGKLISIDSSDGLLNLPDPNTSQQYINQSINTSIEKSASRLDDISNSSSNDSDKLSCIAMNPTLSSDNGGRARGSFLGDILKPSFNEVSSSSARQGFGRQRSRHRGRVNNSQNLSNVSTPQTDEEVSSSSDVRPHFSGNCSPNNQNDPNSGRINADLIKISGITPISFSSSYISTRTKENLINSMRYHHKLLELIEKKTQLIENMSIESSEQLFNIMPPAGMNISYSNVPSSSLNDSATNRSGQLNENRATICELHTSKQSIHEERNTSVRQTTGKLISMNSSGGLPNLPDPNTSQQNLNIPTTKAQNISAHQTTRKLMSINSSGGLSNLPDLNTSQQYINQSINTSIKKNASRLDDISNSSSDDSDKLFYIAMNLIPSSDEIRGSFLGDISRPLFNEVSSSSARQFIGRQRSRHRGRVNNSQNLSNFSRPQTDDEVSSSSDVGPHFSRNHSQNNRNDPNSGRINTDLNNISGIIPISFSSSYISTRTKENLIKSMMYRQKLLELIEKKTQLIENMLIESSEPLSNIMPPAGMNISHSNVSSSSLNDNATNCSGQFNENHATIRELHTSRQSIHEERNTSVHQTTGKLISIDSSSRLSILTDPNTSQKNLNIPTTNTQNISVHQTTGKLASIDSSLGLVELSRVSVPNASIKKIASRLDDISNFPLGDSNKFYLVMNLIPFSDVSDSPQGISSKYLGLNEISNSQQGIATKHLRPSEIFHDSSWSSPRKNLSEFSFLDDSEINLFKLIEDISQISIVDMPKAVSTKCDNEDKIVIKNSDFNDWKINIKSSGSNVPGPSSAPDFPPLAHEKRTIFSPRIKEKATYNLQENGKVSKGTQTDPVKILSMNIDDPQFREPDPPEPIEIKISKIPQIAQEKQVKKSFLPKLIRAAPAKDLNVKISTPKSSPPKKSPKARPSKKFDKLK